MTVGQVADFAELFSGRLDAIGSGRGGVERRRVTLDDYAAHLRGEGDGIGIFPLRDDGTVSFAAIDLDEPDFDAAQEMADLLPGVAWLERSRSGNAHIWAFFAGAIPAWVPRGIMREVLAAVGKPNVEVFPKQDRLGPDMIGNYITLPLHGKERQFLAIPSDLAITLTMEARNDPADWQTRAQFLGIAPPEEREQPAVFGRQPYLHRCAERILRWARVNPVVAGHRSVVYFSVAKQLLNWEAIDEEAAWEQLQNLEAHSPDRIPERELRRIFNNAARRGFTSTGCDDPLMAPYVAPDCPIAHPHH